MTARLPLVVGDDGLPQRLQAGDTLNVPVTGNSDRAATNGESSVALILGMAAYLIAADTYKRAQANSKTTSHVAGLIVDTSLAAGATGTIRTEGVMTATTTQWDAVAGTTAGLSPGSYYFLDPSTPGKITATPPTTPGQCNVLIGRALSTTELDLSIQPPVLL